VNLWAERMTYKWLWLIMLWIPCDLLSQESYITGRVIDSTSHEPLPFVSIVYNQAGQGVVTNLDGMFRIPRNKKVQFLEFRYVGYKTKLIDYNPDRYQNNRAIVLSPEPLGITEVLIFPKENPAHRIIRLVTENRNLNNPEKSGPFSYLSYDKTVFGLETDTTGNHISRDSSGAVILTDSILYGMKQDRKIDLQRFVDKQYLMMMETVSSRKFISPEKNKEVIIASKVSGLTQPSFIALTRQFQSFSFYDDFVNIAGRQYLNPISPGSTDKYFFLIEDTTFTEKGDTVFIISFRPGKGKNFEGMKGVLYINSNRYAIQNVLAEAYEQEDERVRVSIQQQYDFVHNTRWFPVQLSTTIYFNTARAGLGNVPVNIVGTGKSSIVDIDFNPHIEKGEFSDVQIEVNSDAHKQPPSTWKAFRVDTLNAREMETYKVIDSIGKAEHLDRTMTSFETVLTGYLPGNYWNFDLRRFISYNSYEGFRFGLGGRTTPGVSKFFTLGGYGAYSLKDKALKYCGSLTLHVWPKHDADFTLLYRNDVHESGGIKFNEPWDLSGSAFIRDYMIAVMDKVKETEVSFDFRALKYLTASPYLVKSDISTLNGYGYTLNEGSPQVMLTRFSLAETGVKFRYAFKETFMKTPRGNKFSLGTQAPVFYLNVARGINWFDGDFAYWRMEGKITKAIKTRSFGETRLALIAGMVNGDAPYGKLYSGRGSYKSFTVESEQSFGTMRMNEFLSDRFIELYLKQDLGKLLFKPHGKFQPEIALVHNMAFGTLTKPEHQENIKYKTLDKGYFEGGILINNLIRVQLFKYGFGILYRYGPYSFAKTIDNFAFKLTLQLNM
jgi:hypothetical protein